MKNSKNWEQAQLVLKNLIGDKGNRFTLLPVATGKAKSLAWSIKSATLKWHSDKGETIPFEISLVADRATMEKALCRDVNVARYYLATGKNPATDGSRLSQGYKKWVEENPLSPDRVVALNGLYDVFAEYIKKKNGGVSGTPSKGVRMSIPNPDRDNSPITKTFSIEDVPFLKRMGWSIVAPNK